MLTKRKAANSPFRLPLQKVSPRHRELYEILAGRKSGKGFHNADGTILGPQSALLRIAPDRHYVIALEVDGEIYSAGYVVACNADLQAHADRLTVFGPSQAEIERQELAKRRARMTPAEWDEETLKMHRGWGQEVIRTRGEPITRRDRNAPDTNSLV